MQHTLLLQAQLQKESCIWTGVINPINLYMHYISTITHRQQSGKNQNKLQFNSSIHDNYVAH